MLKSLKYQILILLVSIIVAFATVLSFIFPNNAHNLASSILNHDAHFITSLLAENVSLGLQTMVIDDGASLKETIEIINADKNTSSEEAIHSLRVFDPELTQLDYGFKQETMTEFQNTKMDSTVYNETDDLLIAFTSVKDSEGEIIGYLEISFSKQFLNASTNQLKIHSYITTFVILLISLVIGMIYVNRIIGALKQLQEMAGSLAEGNLEKEISIKSNSEIEALASSLNSMKCNIKNLITEFSETNDSIKDGKLDKRSDSGKFKGAYKDLAFGLNEALDAIIVPFNKTANYIDRISKGDIPTKISEDYKGDFTEIKNNVNTLIDNLNNYTADIKQFIDIQREGDFEYKIASDKFQGVFKDMAEGTNEAIQIHVDNILDILDVVNSYGEGDLTVRLRPFPGKSKVANEYIDKVRSNLLSVINEMDGLIHSMVEGDLNNRADSDKYEGSYKQMILGVNQTLDAVIEPLQVSADYVAKIAKGEIPNIIIADYKGDFNAIKNNVNLLINNLNTFIDEMSIMQQAHMLGEIDQFIPVEKFEGVYYKMADGMNITVQDHISGILRILDVIDAYGKGNFSEILEDLKGKRIIATLRVNKFRDNLISIKSDINEMIDAVKEGKLDKRADSEKYHGGWKEIVSGINDMLENTAQPIHEIVNVLGKVSRNDYTEKIISSYEGTWLELKDTVNGTMSRLERIQQILNNISLGDLHELAELKSIGQRSENDKMIPAFIRMMEAIQGLIADTVVLSEAAVAGDFEKRANETRHKGDYQKVIVGLNKTIDSFVNPLIMTGEYLEKVARGENIERYDTDQFNGGFKTLVSYFNTVTAFLEDLIKDIQKTANASIDGDLKIRINSDKYPLQWKEITSGINDILDAVLKPINEAMQVLDVMSTGDLTLRMVGDYKGDHMFLKNSINMLGSSLSQLIVLLSQSIKEVGDSSDSISNTTDTIASSAAEQSSQVDEVAAAMEEMARTITDNSSTASKTANFAQNNGQIATDGGDVVAKTITKMREIAEVVNQSAVNIEKLGQSSKEIGEIISVIDEIADQTNLLALNAAIEAARAGEQGRGFAVVADEVRKLAERTTEATKQIANMIKSIQSETMEAVQVMNKGNEEVSEGINLADNAGDSLKEVVNSSNDVLNMINSIAASSEEQAATGEQISKNINTISAVSNETASSIEDIARSAEQMTSLTIKVRDLIEQFQVDYGTQSSGYQQLESGDYSDIKKLTP